LARRQITKRSTHFSNRTDFSLEKNEQTLLQEELRKRKIKLTDLTNSNPLQCGFEYPTELLSKSLTQRSIYYDPNPKGSRIARQAISKYYSSRGTEVSSDNIILTSSTSEAYSYLFKLLANPGDEILVPQPSYPLFDYLASFESLHQVPYPLFYSDTWHLDASLIFDKITEKTKILLLVNPNNPTGHYIEKHEWKRINNICNEKQLFLICDEVFFDYPIKTSSGRFDPIKNPGCNCFFLNGLSKTAGLPQLKLSWIQVEGSETFSERALKRLELIADTYLSVNTPVQEALPEILSLAPLIRNQILCRIRENYFWLRSEMEDTVITVLDTQGGWSTALRLPNIKSAEDWVIELLERYKVIVHPGDFFGFAFGTFVVVSLLVPKREFQVGVRRIIELVSKTN